MDTTTIEETVWDRLIAGGEFSLGQFVISVHDRTVRVFHSRSRTVTHLRKESSFAEMSTLCRQHGYTLPYLLHSTEPKTYHILQDSERRRPRQRLTRQT